MGAAGADTTGEYLVLLAEGGVDALHEWAGIRVELVVAADLDEPDRFAESNLLFPELGVAVVTADADQLGAIAGAVARESGILAVEPDRVVYALEAPDETEATWGLQATRVTESRFSGAGVRVAVLDTGFDFTHPDFAGRSIVRATFVAGEDVQDGHGHGTHCVGTACGPREPSTPPRYGVAYGADIFVGKVLGNNGRGADKGILAGINWAVSNRCHVVSMSLGAPATVGAGHSAVFEAVARRALDGGTAIVAAAGNDSRRGEGVFAPVSHPANCPSILAVAALDRDLDVAPFSNRGLEPDGGAVDIAAPGVGVYSSWPLPERYNTISGTSMATPHVAGIAALHLEAAPETAATELLGVLTRTAQRLAAEPVDVGAGLVQAP